MWLVLDNLCSVVHVIRINATLIYYPALNDWNTLFVQSICKVFWGESGNLLLSSLWSIHNSYQNQMPLLMHMIQYRIWVRPRCFINQVRPTDLYRPGQNVTQMTRPSFNPGWNCSNNFLACTIVCCSVITIHIQFV